MLLKRQTVWLLTMLSLVVVLSVYYITSPEERGTNLAGVENNDNNEDAILDDGMLNEKEVITINKTDEDIINSLADDEMFTSLRLQLLDERSKQSEQLAKVVATPDIAVEERNEALNEMNNLKNLAETEYLLETLIKALDYDDVLVRASNEEVKVTVKADELSRTEANEILQLVMKELGTDQAYSIEFQPK